MSSRRVLQCLLITLAVVGCHAQTDSITDPETSTDSSCPKSFTLVQDTYCYYMSESDTTWDQANEVCEGLGGWMVSVESAEENTELLSWLENNGMTFFTFFSGPYIGIRRFNMSSDDFT
jgi:hypothetical protein